MFSKKDAKTFEALETLETICSKFLHENLLMSENFVSLHHRYKSSLPVIEEATYSKDDDKERYDECPDVGDT